MTTDRAPWTGWFLVLLAIAILFLTRQYAEGQAMPDPLPQRTSEAGPLSNDPLQVCARKALEGKFGHLPSWKQAAYEWVIAKGVTVPADNRSKCTSYGKWEPCGTHTFSGDRFSIEFVSVPPKHIPLGAIVWTPWGLRYAMDTGGAVKARSPYIRRSENMNLDYATARWWPTKRNVPWVIVKRKTSWNWYGERLWGDYSKQGQR